MGAARARIARAAKHDVLGHGAVADLVAGCALFDVLREGCAVASFALRVDQHAACRILTVTGAGGDSAVGAVDAIAAFCEGEKARIEADVLTCETKRPGLVRLLKRRGYSVAGYVMRKG